MAKGINLIITVDGNPVMIANSLLLNLMCNCQHPAEPAALWETKSKLPEWELTEHFTNYAKTHIKVIIEAMEIDESVLENDS